MDLSTGGTAAFGCTVVTGSAVSTRGSTAASSAATRATVVTGGAAAAGGETSPEGASTSQTADQVAQWPLETQRPLEVQRCWRYSSRVQWLPEKCSGRSF